MKNFTTGISIAALIGVIVLLIMQFSKSKTTAINSTANTTNNFSVAYFEMDSVQANFNFYKEVAKELGLSEQQKKSELLAKKNAYIEKAKAYQAKGQSMTQAEVASAQQDLAQREREYQAAEQNKTQEMQEESFKKLQDVKQKIEDYLKQYNANKKYALIIANTPEMIYYKDTSLNITNDLIKGLNELYKKKN
jgi:outer membrane protein